MKKIIIEVFILISCILLSSCTEKTSLTSTSTTITNNIQSTTSTDINIPTINKSDFKIKYVSGTKNAYTYENNTITFNNIKEDSVYNITGTFVGNIVIDVSDDYKFELELSNFSMSSTLVNPITVLNGDEVQITAKNNTENNIYDNREKITDEALYSAAIYSTVDLEIGGKGKLNVISVNNNGIHTKDDLKVKNLNLYVKCVDNCLKGNDSVELKECTTMLISTQGDCIKTSNSHINQNTGNQKGTINVNGGTHNLYAACDGIDSSYDVEITESNTVLNIYTDKYSSYSEKITDVSSSIYYIKYTSNQYKYSVKYYNSDEDYCWVNVSNEYKTVSGGMGRPGQGSINYYYYPFSKLTGYEKVMVYMYTSNQAQGQDIDYYACSSYKTINNNYDTIEVTYYSNKINISWTNYTTTTTSNQPGGRPGGPGMNEGNKDKGDHSTKGIKAANRIVINNGLININSYDDAIHSNNDGGVLENGNNPLGDVTINGGNITIYTNDDGIHADNELVINNGNISITKSYEGFEGKFIIVNNGNISVLSSDDGFNATSTSGAAISVNGGYIYVYCTGDGFDSNSRTSKGAISFAGGKTIIISNSNGNSSIDSDGGYSYTGGRVIAIMPRGGMTGESTNCSNFKNVGLSKSMSLSNNKYLVVKEEDEIISVIKMPITMSNAFIVYLGSSSAELSSIDTINNELDSNGVYWK